MWQESGDLGSVSPSELRLGIVIALRPAAMPADQEIRVSKEEALGENPRQEPAESAESASDDDRRHERRYPVVGIEVLFSPFDGKVLENAGKMLREAVAFDISLSGLSFDVTEPVAEGEELLIQIADPAGGQDERILAEVRWCHKIDHAHYRIGTRIKEAQTASASGVAAGELASEAIGRGPQVPSGAEFRCPACADLTRFTLIGLQSGTWEKGVFPLYQCGGCASSRSIIAILSYNRFGF